MPRARHILTIRDLLFSAVFSISVLILGLIPGFIRYINGEEQQLTDQYFEATGLIVDKILIFLGDSLLTPDIATMLLWGILGVIAYFSVSVFMSSVETMSDSYKMTKHYIHPKNFHATSYILHVALHSISGLAAFGLLLFWTIMSLRYLIGQAFDTASLLLFSDDIAIASRFLYALLAVGAIMVTILGYIVFVRVVSYIRYRIQT
jgi:hypothetical protein